MSFYGHIKRCLELSDKDIGSAIGDRRLTKALLDQLAKVSKAGDGAPKLLLVFSKMAAEQVDWVDGSLRIDMVGEGDATSVEVLTELGLGMSERVFPSFKMNVPLEEFARAVERVPHMIAPLTIATTTGKRLVLASNPDDAEADPSFEYPSAVEIGDDSLYGSAGYETVEKAKGAGGPPIPNEQAKRTTSSAKNRAVKNPSRPAPTEAASVPRVISPTSGKTLRPAPMKPRSGPPPLPGGGTERPEPKSARGESSRPSRRESVKPPKRESTQATKRDSLKMPRASERPPPPASAQPALPKPAPLPRIEKKAGGAAIARVALTKVAAGAPRIAARAAVEKRRSTKPPPAPKRASKAPPAKTKGRGGKSMSEPPDEEGIDLGWEDE